MTFQVPDEDSIIRQSLIHSHERGVYVNAVRPKRLTFPIVPMLQVAMWPMDRNSIQNKA